MICIIHRKDKLVEDLKQQVSEDEELKNIKFIEVSLIDNNIILKILRKLHIFFKIPRKDIWLDKSKLESIEKEDIIIFFDSYTFEYLDLANKLKNKKKIWLWNQLDKSKCKYVAKMKEIFKNQIWSFDPKDCKKENFNFTSQFYWRKKDNEKIEGEEYDLLFIGRDKGRYKFLEKFFFFLKKGKMRIFGAILKEKFKLYPASKYLTNKFFEYSEIIRLIEKSQCILDINKEEQEGLTLRVMEAIFFEKKLITNNLEIIKYDFYTPENIYILNDIKKINYSEIIDFINAPHRKVDEIKLEKYTFKFWLKNILKERE